MRIASLASILRVAAAVTGAALPAVAQDTVAPVVAPAPRVDTVTNRIERDATLHGPVQQDERRAPARARARERAAVAPPAPANPRAVRAAPTSERQNERTYDRAIDQDAALAARQAEARRERQAAEPVEPVGPFDPVGVRVGSFVLRPSLTTTLGFDDNVLRTTRNTTTSAFQTVAPQLTVRSDWSRHAVDAEIRGSYTTYNSVPRNDRPELDARLRGRLDVTDRAFVETLASQRVTTENPGSPDAPTGAKRPPLVTTTSGELGVVHGWNRLQVALRGSIDHVWYEDADLRDGSRIDNGDRVYDEYGLRLRASYEIAPGVRPFVEARVDSRRFDRAVDDDGFRRRSTGQRYLVGSSFELTRLLTGEAAVGWLVRHYADPRLDTASGLLVDTSLVWAVTGLTNIRLTGRTTIDETTQAGTTAVFRREARLAVEHAFRRWLIATAEVGYGTDDYGAGQRKDERTTLAGRLDARIGRQLWLTSEVRHERLDSNQPDTDYTANVVMVGLRFQR